MKMILALCDSMLTHRRSAFLNDIYSLDNTGLDVISSPNLKTDDEYTYEYICICMYNSYCDHTITVKTQLHICEWKSRLPRRPIGNNLD